jgi:hypothetical protein
MLWYSKQFTPEYDATSSVLAAGGFAASFTAVGTALAKAMGTAGLEASGQRNPAMVPGLPQASRAAPPGVPSVTHAGIRYEQLDDERLPGIDPDANYVVARDAGSIAVLWMLQIYRTEVVPGLETDVQAVYFKSMRLGADSARLLIEDEIGRHFVVDLAARAVRQIAPTQH